MELLEAINIARSNGWKKNHSIDWDFLTHYYRDDDFWRMFLLNKEFAVCFWGSEWENKLKEAVLSDNLITFITHEYNEKRKRRETAL